MTAVAAQGRTDGSRAWDRLGQYDPNAYCCVANLITSVTYVPGKSITVTWQNPDPIVTAAELHAGSASALDGRGIINIGAPGGWEGNITEQHNLIAPSTSVSFQNGADDTIGELSFNKDFLVQIWFRCFNYNNGNSVPDTASPYCSTPNSNPDHWPEFYSATYKVHVAGTPTTTTPASGTSGGGLPAGKPVIYAVVSGPATVTGQGKNDRTMPLPPGPAALVTGEVLAAGKAAVTLAAKEGRIVLDKQSSLYLDVPGQVHVLDGTVWFSGFPGFPGKYYRVVDANATVRPLGAATFTVSDCLNSGSACGPRGSTVSVYSGKVDVAGVRPPGKQKKKLDLVLSAGFQTFVPFTWGNKGGLPTAARRFTPPPNPFWKP